MERVPPAADPGAKVAPRASALARRIAPIMGVVAVGLAAALLWRALRRYSLDDIVRSVAAIPRKNVALAIVFAAASYATLTLFDALGVRYAGGRISYGRVALASFCSLSIGHNLGFAALSTGAIRYRFYGGWGL